MQNQKIWIKIDENDFYKSNKEKIQAWEIGIHKESLSNPYYINTNVEKEKHIGKIAFLFGFTILSICTLTKKYDLIINMVHIYFILF